MPVHPIAHIAKRNVITARLLMHRGECNQRLYDGGFIDEWELTLRAEEVTAAAEVLIAESDRLSATVDAYNTINTAIIRCFAEQSERELDQDDAWREGE